MSIVDRFKRLARTARDSMHISLWVVVLSTIFWLLGPVRQPGEGIWNRLWIAGVGLLCVGVLVFGLAMTLVWLFFDRRPLRTVIPDVSVILVSGTILIALIAIGLRIDNGLSNAQLDVVQAICAEGFRDPLTLEKYGRDRYPIGGWDDADIWVDDSRNAIWIETCGSLSSCGVMCVRPGIALENSSRNYPFIDFKYLREGLYTWD